MYIAYTSSVIYVCVYTICDVIQPPKQAKRRINTRYICQRRDGFLVSWYNDKASKNPAQICQKYVLNVLNLLSYIFSTFLTCCVVTSNDIFTSSIHTVAYSINRPRKRGPLKVPRNSGQTLYRDYTSRKRCDSVGKEGEKNFISRTVLSRVTACTKPSVIYESELARARAQLPGTRPSALKICGRAPPAEIDGRAEHATCNYNYKSLETRRGRTRVQWLMRVACGLATAPKFIRRRAIRNLNMQRVVFMRRYMRKDGDGERGRGGRGRGRNETRRFRWKLVFLSRFFYFSCGGENY